MYLNWFLRYSCTEYLRLSMLYQIFMHLLFSFAQKLPMCPNIFYTQWKKGVPKKNQQSLQRFFRYLISKVRSRYISISPARSVYVVPPPRNLSNKVFFSSDLPAHFLTTLINDVFRFFYEVLHLCFEDFAYIFMLFFYGGVSESAVKSTVNFL